MIQITPRHGLAKRMSFLLGARHIRSGFPSREAAAKALAIVFRGGATEGVVFQRVVKVRKIGLSGDRLNPGG